MCSVQIIRPERDKYGMSELMTCQMLFRSIGSWYLATACFQDNISASAPLGFSVLLILKDCRSCSEEVVVSLSNYSLEIGPAPHEWPWKVRYSGGCKGRREFSAGTR